VNTNKGDVGLVLGYIEKHLPDLYHTLTSMNGVGARTIVNGLLAYGWTEEEVKSSPIPFMKAVRKYLDENLMIPPTEGVDPTTQKPDTTNQSSKKRAGDENSIRRTGEDHAHKIHTSHQSSSAFDEHTAETSPPDDFGVEHHCPGSASISSPAGDIPDDVTTRHIEDDSMDPWMADTLRSCVDSYESWLLANNLQRSNSSLSGQRQVVSMDPRMPSSLCALDCLPSSLEQEPSRVNMTSTLGAMGSLTSSLEPSSRVLTVNPNVLTVDPCMTSSLGELDYPPRWSEIQVGRGSSQYFQT
tara:strand:- start:1415 stop:2311 length:897 start_codon:yes stop_codon:yes gene_type:complete